MSLNRCEESLLHYVRDRPDEHRFWSARVLELDRGEGSAGARVATLERELRAYAVERGRADPALLDTFGGGRVSLRNLAEYLLAVWTPPRPPRRRAGRAPEA